MSGETLKQPTLGQFKSPFSAWSWSFPMLALALAPMLAPGNRWRGETFRWTAVGGEKINKNPSNIDERLDACSFLTKGIIHFLPHYRQLPPNFRRPPHPCFILLRHAVELLQVRLRCQRPVTSLWRSSPRPYAAEPEMHKISTKRRINVRLVLI